MELPLPKNLMSIESVDNVGAANSASMTVAQQEIHEIVESTNSKVTADNQVPSIEEFDGDDAFWDDDQDVQLELSDKQKAARVEIDALFG
ncbi:MAG: hypothetical protein KME28_16015 [Pelatocladus maniniholoensis HA4357-MV3]|uniref:Uncharacterized protein n=1 Tax=Pelatocladus maniniholoensis HA4357-MV3 TaxID=1117104 RepID=A0A9E3LTV1_9NOST|nr:hypothetical protein [Pelatocladus maniniholoensis HA4357-MV3]